MAARGPDSFDIMFNSCMYILFVRGASVCQWGHGRHHGNVAASYTDSSAWLLWWSSTLDECQWPPMHTVGWFVVALWHVEQELYWFRCSCAQKWKSELPFLLWLGSPDVSVPEVYRFSFSSFAYFEQIVTAALAQEQPMLFFFFVLATWPCSSSVFKYLLKSWNCHSTFSFFHVLVATCP